MPLTPGLAPNIRLEEPEPDALPPGEEVVIEDAPEGVDVPHLDDKGAILQIEHPDGSITITTDGRPLEGPKEAGETKW